MLVPACREIFRRPPYSSPIITEHTLVLRVFTERPIAECLQWSSHSRTRARSLSLCLLLAAYYVLPSNKSFLRWGGTFPLLRDISEEEGWGLGGGYGGLHLHPPPLPSTPAPRLSFRFLLSLAGGQDEWRSWWEDWLSRSSADERLWKVLWEIIHITCSLGTAAARKLFRCVGLL